MPTTSPQHDYQHLQHSALSPVEPGQQKKHRPSPPGRERFSRAGTADSTGCADCAAAFVDAAEEPLEHTAFTSLAQAFSPDHPEAVEANSLHTTRTAGTCRSPPKAPPRGSMPCSSQSGVLGEHRLCRLLMSNSHLCADFGPPAVTQTS